MKKILLKNRNLFTQIDDEDFERVSEHTWHAVWNKSAKSFYVRTNVRDENTGKQKAIQLHRFVLGITDPEVLVDHEDHDTLNNQKGNLREASQTENQQNQLPRKNGKSLYKGVCRTKNGNKWRAQIRFNGVKLHLGEFDMEIEAAYAYDVAAVKCHGKFALLNFPKEGTGSSLPVLVEGSLEPTPLEVELGTFTF